MNNVCTFFQLTLKVLSIFEPKRMKNILTEKKKVIMKYIKFYIKSHMIPLQNRFLLWSSFPACWWFWGHSEADCNGKHTFISLHTTYTGVQVFIDIKTEKTSGNLNGKFMTFTRMLIIQHSMEAKIFESL